MAKKWKSKRILAFTMAAFMAISTPMTSVRSYADELTLKEYEEILDTYSIDESIVQYKEFVKLYQNATKPSDKIYIKGDDVYRYLDEDGNEVEAKLDTSYSGTGDKSHASVYTGEAGAVEYKFTVKTEGLYDIALEYYPTTEGGNSAAIQRGILLDGKLPYDELAMVEFQRVWKCNFLDKVYTDQNGVKVIMWDQDNQGNQLKPTLVEAPEWVSTKVYDSEGYVTTPLSLYLTPGEHVISFVSVREPMIIHSITLSNENSLKSYAEVKKEWDNLGAKDATAQIRIEAENASKTSSQMLYPVQDQSSPAVYPSSAKELLNNSIGGNSWRLTGQWIEWEFEVTEAGYYTLSMFDKQNFVKGTYVSRKIMVDGVVPFEEFSDYAFKYQQSWRYDTMKDENGDPYKLYFTAGKHTLRMEVVLGEFSDIIGNVQDCVTALNAIYRKVIRITGVQPDSARDYHIKKNLPTIKDELKSVYDLLSKTIIDLRTVAGKTSDKETVLITMRDQLEVLEDDPEKFVRVLADFKTNVRACGNWITSAIEQPLQVDTIFVNGAANDVTAKKNANWFVKFWYELKRLFYSFIIDYNQVGNVADGSKNPMITLWIGTGRDQANVIKSLIDETFTAKYNIDVNVMLVDMGTLLQATLAGQGPDVAIQVGYDLPMNYGIRNAALDLTRFSDLEEVKTRFHESAFNAFEFNGATYALPETQTFPVMFYRKDILAEIGLEVPETWDDVKVALSVLDDNQMEFGMLPAEQIFAMLLEQNGGQYYNEDGSKSLLDSDIAVSTFKDYCEFYTDYKLDKTTSVEERFRTGEAPLIIADYTVYNNFQVSAPDIKGLWSFAMVPGTRKEDGTVDHSVGSQGTASIIMSATKEPDASWEFLKWWSSAETQISYGKEMESLMGAAARVATANKEAFAAMPWPKSDFEALQQGFSYASGIRHVPGSYYTWRSINNAFYSVTTKTDTVSPREELMDWVLRINEELTFKRKEFNLPLAE